MKTARIAATLAAGAIAAGLAFATPAGAVVTDHYRTDLDLAADGWSSSAGATIGHTFPQGHVITFAASGYVWGYPTSSDLTGHTVACASTVTLSVRYAGAWHLRATLHPTMGGAVDCQALWKYAPTSSARWRVAYAGCPVPTCTVAKPAAHEDLNVDIG